MSPPQLYQGLSGTLTITGADFYPGVWVDFGPDVFIDRTAVQSSTTIEVGVTVFNTAAPGIYDLSVMNRDFQEDVLVGALEILPTTRHYYSPTGGDNFPYITPVDAATDIEDAVAAGYHGDTLYVPTQTFADFSIQIDNGVLLYGGWNADFTARDLATGKTVLQLAGNVSVFPGANGGGLDGFIVEDGDGATSFTPFMGRVGGAVRVIEADAVFADCEFRNSAASDGTKLGIGGAIYVQEGSLELRDCYIHDNSATWGGGIFMYNSSGALTGNTIAGNAIAASTDTPYGAGVYLMGCDGVTFTDNTIDGNTGAKNGGGILAEYSTNVTVNGGLIANGAATFQGGGVCAIHSDIDFDGVEFAHNDALLGGGIGATDTSTVSATDCRFTWNTAIVGAGFYAQTGEAHVTHNLFVGNTATSAGAGAYVSGVTDGVVAGNTMDRNAAAASSGLFVGATTIDVFNNVVSNTVGNGIGASGATLPWVGYNLVWNSSGSDYDGTPAGEGAVAGDPVFADTSAGDYHLGPHSPAIDAGRPGGAFEDPDGSPGDMGWYGSRALVMAQPSYPQGLAAALESGDVVLRWAKNPEADVVSYYVYRDTVGDFKPSASNFVASVPETDSTVTLPAPADSAFYVVSAIDGDGYAGGYSNVAFVGAATGATETGAFNNRLYQNVPNPFNPATTIQYELRAPAAVSLSVFDVAGRLVKRLVDEQKTRGVHKIAWDGTSDSGARVSSGIYFYKLNTGSFVQTRKMLLLK